MSTTDAVIALLAGLWGGTINTVVGSGTLVSFPVLLGLGLPPVVANVTNTVGLFPGSLAGAWGYRRELKGQGRRIAVLSGFTIAGSIGGAALLLTLPPDAFERVVPWLIALALVLVVGGPRFTAMLRNTRYAPTGRTTVGVVAVAALCAVYGGYFGAAQGVLMMGFMGMLLAEDLQRLNALKNVLTGLTNLVAAAVFAVVADVQWGLAAMVAAGAIMGGLLGARIGRRLPPAVLRGVIVVVGAAAMVSLLR
ncbi:sulfite exporter TauE/SafE family protein [Aeromicrobium sp. CTD01-1L150]|uniref:sulfite exporter TauE/SafE family protein n=1 Tax=Aeromicrobium sp. CTD01-1L150 TaxID=3341830 RepID=UPI0035BEEBCD